MLLAAFSLMVGLSACAGNGGTQTTTGNLDGVQEIKLVLEDGTRLHCLIRGGGGLDCDWASAVRP